MMNPAEKLNDALYALNAILVHLRSLAYEQAPHATLAQLLDTAELLPMLIARNDDTTAEFRSYLEALIAMDGRFTHALQRFDGETWKP